MIPWAPRSKCLLVQDQDLHGEYDKYFISGNYNENLLSEDYAKTLSGEDCNENLFSEDRPTNLLSMGQTTPKWIPGPVRVALQEPPKEERPG